MPVNKSANVLFELSNNGTFNIEITDIRKINKLSNNEIKPGQVLKIIIKAF